MAEVIRRSPLTARGAMWLCWSAVLVIYAVISFRSTFLFYDFHGSVQWSQELPGGDWNNPIYAVGYRLFLRGLFEVIGDYAIAGKLISLAGMAIALYATWRIGAIVSGSEWAGLAVMLLTACNRTFLLWGTTPNTDLISWAFGLAGMAVFLTGARAGRCLGWRSALIAGALFGLGYIMRYSVAVVAGVTGVWLLFDIRNWPRRDGLANLLAFVLGFLVTAAVQMIPSMLETGSPVTGILPKMFWMAYEWETKHIPYGLLYERYRDMPMQQLLPEMLSIKFQLALYYLDHLKVELITGSPHVWGPAVAVVAYPAIAVATWRIGSARRSGLAYILFVGLAVMLFHGLVVYAARYLLITIPAVLVCLVLAARELSVLIAQFAEPRRLRSAARAVLMVGLILWLGVNLFAEARVLAMREANQRYLAPVAEQMGKAATSARQVGTVFMPCAAYYDTTSRFKEVYDEIPLQPGATIAELRTEMRNTGRQFVIVDKCSGNLYPTLASAFLSSATLEGFTRVFAFPAEKPFVTAFRLTDANNTDLSTGSNQ